MRTKALTNRISSGRWLGLLTASALAHGAAIFAMPTVSIAPFSINADDALTVTLLQISPAAVEQRHPAKQPLTAAVAQTPIRPAIIPTPRETKTSPPQEVPLVAVTPLKSDSGDIAQAPTRRQQTPTTVSQTSPAPEPAPLTARAATTRPVEVTPVIPDPVLPAVVVVKSDTPANRTAAREDSVEAADDDSGDEFEDDDSAPYAESADADADTPIATAVSAEAEFSKPAESESVDIAANIFVDTSRGASESESTLAPEMTLASANTQPDEPIVPTPTFPARTATSSEMGVETAFNESAIRREIRARFDHNLVYPPLARKRGWEGNVDVMLRVSRHGSIEVLKVVESSGFGILDRYTRKTLEHIRLDNQFLQSLQGSHRDLRIEVQYQLIASRG